MSVNGLFRHLIFEWTDDWFFDTVEPGEKGMMDPKKIPSLFLALAIVGLVLTGQLEGQVFTTLHNFTGGYGGGDASELILSGNTLYGTTASGGLWGTVLKVNIDGSDFTTLHIFTSNDPGTNSDGATPTAGLTLSGNTLYGTASSGGTFGRGTIFKLSTDGTGFTTLHSFVSDNEGANPSGPLILSSNTLYGTTFNGGSLFCGSVFKVNTDGRSFNTLHSFAGPPEEGDGPPAGLILSGNTLYGTTYFGGAWDDGTVFSVNTDGTGFTNLHSFTQGAYDEFANYTNSDGAYPSYGNLVLSGSALFGITIEGGNSGNGVVFAINIDGTGFTNLHSLGCADCWSDDGASPRGGLILSGSTLYGTAYYGGNTGNGTVFAVNTNGTDFTTFYNFTGPLWNTNSDGYSPASGLTLFGNVLYGTAEQGGAFGYGTVFSISFWPQLEITSSETNVVLAWPLHYAGFDYSGYVLQSATNLGPSAVWTTNLPSPGEVNGQNTVTNPFSGTQQFFRLSQ